MEKFPFFKNNFFIFAEYRKLSPIEKKPRIICEDGAWFCIGYSYLKMSLAASSNALRSAESS